MSESKVYGVDVNTTLRRINPDGVTFNGDLQNLTKTLAFVDILSTAINNLGLDDLTDKIVTLPSLAESKYDEYEAKVLIGKIQQRKGSRIPNQDTYAEDFLPLKLITMLDELGLDTRWKKIYTMRAAVESNNFNITTDLSPSAIRLFFESTFPGWIEDNGTTPNMDVIGSEMIEGYAMKFSSYYYPTRHSSLADLRVFFSDIRQSSYPLEAEMERRNKKKLDENDRKPLELRIAKLQHVLFALIEGTLMDEIKPFTEMQILPSGLESYNFEEALNIVYNKLVTSCTDLGPRGRSKSSDEIRNVCFSKKTLRFSDLCSQLRTALLRHYCQLVVANHKGGGNPFKISVSEMKKRIWFTKDPLKLMPETFKTEALIDALRTHPKSAYEAKIERYSEAHILENFEAFYKEMHNHAAKTVEKVDSSQILTAASFDPKPSSSANNPNGNHSADGTKRKKKKGKGNSHQQNASANNTAIVQVTQRKDNCFYCQKHEADEYDGHDYRQCMKRPNPRNPNSKSQNSNPNKGNKGGSYSNGKQSRQVTRADTASSKSNKRKGNGNHQSSKRQKTDQTDDMLNTISHGNFGAAEVALFRDALDERFGPAETQVNHSSSMTDAADSSSDESSVASRGNASSPYKSGHRSDSPYPYEPGEVDDHDKRDRRRKRYDYYRIKYIDAILDSGANRHVFNSTTGITNLRKTRVLIRLPNKSYTTARQSGNLGRLRNILIARNVETNLISSSQLLRSNKRYVIISDSQRAFLINRTRSNKNSRKNHITASFSVREDGLYHCDNMQHFVDEEAQCNSVATLLTDKQARQGSAQIRYKATTAGLNPLEILHVKNGHANEHLLKWMVQKNVVNGLQYTYNDVKNLHLPLCPACMQGRMKAFPILPSISTNEYLPGEYISFDIISFKVKSIRNYKYSAIYVDKSSGKVIAHHLKRKSDLLKSLKDVCRLVSTLRPPRKLRFLQSDPESVTTSSEFKDYLAQPGVNIKPLKAAPKKHQQVLAESYIGTIKDGLLTTLAYNNAPRRLWDYALSYYVDTHGCLSRMGEAKSRNELFYGSKPDVSHHVPFYAKGFHHVTKEERSQLREGKNLAMKGRNCRMLGYASNYDQPNEASTKNSYLVAPLSFIHSSEILIRHDCYFEHYTDPVVSLLKPDENKRTVYDVPLPIDYDSLIKEPKHKEQVAESPDDYEVASDNDSTVSDSTFVPGEVDDVSSVISDIEPTLPKKKVTFDLPQRKKREKRSVPPRPLGEHNLRSKSKLNNLKIFNMTFPNDLPECPKNTYEALKSKYRKEWIKAMLEETQKAVKRNTFKVLPAGYKPPKKPIKSKWVFRIKRNPDGTLKFKARLVACGYSQVYGRDYEKTFSPTCKYQSFCTIIHIAATLGWCIKGLDVENAYLEAEIDKEIYMTLPTDTWPTTITVRILKSLYGLKQAGELWNELLDSVIIKIGFRKSIHDSCVYIYRHDDDICFVVIWVDDVILAGNSNSLVDWVIATVAKAFIKITTQDELTKFIGIDLTRDWDEGTITLSQADYAEKVIKGETGDSSTPLDPTVDYREKGNNDLPAMNDVVGELRYLADRTRPDLLIPASFLASAATNPSEIHRKGLKKIHKYIRSTVKQGVKLGGEKAIKLFSFADCSWITKHDSKSQLGYCLFLNRTSGAIMARTVKDTTVSHSSCEGEVKAIDLAIIIIIWFRGFLDELGFPQKEPTIIYTDSKAAEYLSESYNISHKTAHIVMRLNFIHQEVQKGTVKLKYVNTENQVADILTKQLPTKQFLRLRNFLFKGFGGNIEFLTVNRKPKVKTRKVKKPKLSRSTN